MADSKASTLNPNNLTAADNILPNKLAGQALQGVTSKYKTDDKFDFFSTQAYNLISGNFLKLLPYRFVVAEARLDPKTQQTTYNYAGNVPLVYILPINPQNITIKMPFAARPTALADGILVESNGAPFRNITIAGTTGLLPFKSSQMISGNNGTLSTVSTAITQASSIASSAKSISNGFKTGDTNALTGDPVFDNNGYAQFHKLFKFFEYWAFLSKAPENQNLRLVLQMQRENLNYIVTPLDFGWIKEASSPLENKYNIQLVAWKQIDAINSNAKALPSNPLQQALDYNALARISNAITNVRKILTSASDIIRAVRADVDSVLDVVRQVSLAVKQAINAATTLMDMPKSIIQGTASTLAQSQSAIQGAWNNLQDSAKQLAALNPQQVFNDEFKRYQTFKGNNNQNQPNTGVGNQSTVSTSGGTPTGSLPSQGSNIAAKNAIPANSQNNNPFQNRASVFYNVLNQPDKNFDFLNSINVNSLSGLPPALSQQINQELSYVKQFRRKDFENVRITINQLSRDLATAWGGGDAGYDKAAKYVGGKQPIPNRKISRSEIDLLNSIRNLAQALDELSAQEDFGNSKTPIDSRFDYIGKLVAPFGIPFEPSRGKQAVPVLYGMNMQEMAAYYLGNPDLDNEIIALNALLPPFIDEDGTTVNLLTNGAKNQINVADASMLNIGQKIIVGSGTVPPSNRTILNISKNSTYNWVITIDGDPVDALKTANGAYMTYYKPNTVNSSNLIFIPTNKYPINNYPDKLKPITFLPDVDKLQKISRIDILLDVNGDIVVNSQGQIGLAGGLTNLIQALRIKALTPRNSLFRHPEFGFGIEPGTSVAALDLNDYKNNIISNILSDPRFGDVVGLQLNLNGNTLKISGGINIATQDNNLLPFDIELN